MAGVPSLSPDDGPDPQLFRTVLGHFPTGVTIVTARGPRWPVGLSVNSFTSVSLDPPLVGFFPAHASGSWPVIRAAGGFCVSILGDHQELATAPAPYTGAPVVAGAVAWLDCTIESITPAGDHDFALGRVRALGTDPNHDPLLFHLGRYRSFDDR
jgi:flavin reductase (DIM6/NTAB) family NADH-FMN oxidoreductase RutF